MTPKERTLRASLAAHEMHGQGKTNTGPARKAWEQRFYDLADPDGTLPPAERERRAAHLRTAHMTRLSLAAARARQTRTSSRPSTP